MWRLNCFPGVVVAYMLTGASTATHAGVQVEGATQPWFRQAIVGMEVGPTGAQFGHSDPNDARYCSQFDGRDIVRRCVSAHCDYLVIWARDGDYAYYDSKLLPKAPGLGSRDLLRETVAEAARHKLPVVVYCVVQQDGHYLREHPEFEMRDPAGNRIGRFCYNSGYLDVMKQIVAEQLAYGIAGFHIDMLDQGFGPAYGCWCEQCRKMFEARYGHAMPTGVTWNEQWDDMYLSSGSRTVSEQLNSAPKRLLERAGVGPG